MARSGLDAIMYEQGGAGLREPMYGIEKLRPGEIRYTMSEKLRKLVKKLESLAEIGFYGEFKIKFENGEPVISYETKTEKY